MVLGWLRRRRGRGKGATPRLHPQQGNPPVTVSTPQPITGPLGEFTDDGYIPDPRELAIAQPLPQLGFESGEVVDLLSEEELGWALLSKDTWRPRRARKQRGALMVDPVRLPGRRWPYEAIIWNGDGRVYLADALTFALLRDATGEMTARDLVEKTLTGFIEHLPKHDEIRRAFETDPSLLDEDTKYWMEGMIASFYAQLALLKKLGLLE